MQYGGWPPYWIWDGKEVETEGHVQSDVKKIEKGRGRNRQGTGTTRGRNDLSPEMLMGTIWVQKC